MLFDLNLNVTIRMKSLFLEIYAYGFIAECRWFSVTCKNEAQHQELVKSGSGLEFIQRTINQNVNFLDTSSRRDQNFSFGNLACTA